MINIDKSLCMRVLHSVVREIWFGAPSWRLSSAQVLNAVILCGNRLGWTLDHELKMLHTDSSFKMCQQSWILSNSMLQQPQRAPRPWLPSTATLRLADNANRSTFSTLPWPFLGGEGSNHNHAELCWLLTWEADCLSTPVCKSVKASMFVKYWLVSFFCVPFGEGMKQASNLQVCKQRYRGMWSIWFVLDWISLWLSCNTVEWWAWAYGSRTACLSFSVPTRSKLFKQTPTEKIVSVEIHDDHAELIEIHNPNLGILKRSDSLIPCIDISGYCFLSSNSSFKLRNGRKCALFSLFAGLSKKKNTVESMTYCTECPL